MNASNGILIGGFIANMVHLIVGFSLDIYTRSAITRVATVPPSLVEINEEYNSCIKNNSRLEYCNDTFAANIHLHNKIIQNKGH